MHIQLVQVLQQGAKRRALGHLGEGVDVLGEALASITILTVGSRDIGVGIIYVAREENSCMHITPVSSHLLAVLTASVEVGYFVSTKDIVHVLGKFGLKGGHHGELLTHEYLGQQILRSCKDHRLFIEVFNKGSFSQKFGHITHLVAGLTGEHLAGAGQDGGTYKYGHIGQVGDEFLHQRKVLRTIVLGGYVDLQKGDIDITQVVIVTLIRVTDKQFAFRVVMLQPILQGSTYEATSNNSNVNHFLLFI